MYHTYMRMFFEIIPIVWKLNEDDCQSNIISTMLSEVTTVTYNSNR